MPGLFRLLHYLIKRAKQACTGLVNHSASRIAHALIEEFDLFRRGTEVLHQTGPSVDGLDDILLQSAELFRLTDPGPRIDLRIRDGHGQLKDVICRPPVSL